LVNPESCVSAKGECSKKSRPINWLNLNNEAEMLEFSAQQADIEVLEFSAQQADANPFNLKNVDRYAVHNCKRSRIVATSVMQYITYISKLFTIPKTSSNILSISYMLHHRQYFFALQ
jgi:hypothetical protein